MAVYGSQFTGKASLNNIAYIGIGSNMGDRLGFCRKAVTALRDCEEIQTFLLSSLYETEPVDYLAQDYFYNAVIAIQTTLSPQALLASCQKIETVLEKNIQISKGPRTIDLDLLFYNDHVLTSSDLTLPHPGVVRRLFVLIPLAEIAPRHIHPGENCSIETLVNRFQSDQLKAVEKRFDAGWEKR